MFYRFKWFFLIFCVLIISACHPYSKIESFKYNQNILLDGIVTNIPTVREDDIEFIFYTPKYGDLLLRANINDRKNISPGNKLRLNVKLHKKEAHVNINSFSYSKYLDNNGVVATGRVIVGSDVIYKGTSIAYLPERLRYSLYKHLKIELKAYQTSPMMLALLIGDKNLNASEKELFMQSGTSHLMVISGLHIGLLAFIAFILMRLLWSSSIRLCRKVPAQYAAVIFSILVAFAYSLLVGFSLPTQRAVAMITVAGALWLCKKRISLVRSLCVAFVFMLLLDVKSIYSVSMWLSFLAVIFLIFISTIARYKNSNILNNISSQVYLAIFLIPVSVYYFDGFSIVSVAANLIAIPFISFIIVPLLLLSLVLSFVSIHICMIANALLNVLVLYLSFLTEHIHLVNYWSYFSTISLILVTLGLCIVVTPIRISFRLLGLALCLVFFQSNENLTSEYNSFQLHVFHTKNQMVMISNQGASVLYTSYKNLSDMNSLTTLNGYLKFTGIDKIDTLIVSGDTKSTVNIDNISDLTIIGSVVTNLPVNTVSEKCVYQNNYNVKGMDIKLLGDGNKSGCFVNIQSNNRLFLLFNNVSTTQQNNIYKIYGRVMNADNIITPVIPSRYLIKKLDPSLLIYSSNKELSKTNYKYLNKNSVSVIDVYKNGAVTFAINNDHVNINGQYKKY